MSRSQKRASLPFICMLVIVMALLSACGSPQDPQPAAPAPPTTDTAEPVMGGVLRVAHNEVPPSVDMHWSTSVSTMIIGTHVVETLFGHDENYEMFPMLADRYTVSDDGLTYVIHLREGVKFHNGEEMTSEDVVASLERWMTRGSVARGLANSLESIEATGKYVVTFRLKHELGTLIPILGMPNQGGGIYPKSLLDSVGEGNEITHPIGTGPYRFVENLPDRWIKLSRFEDCVGRDDDVPRGYAGKKVAYFDEIVFVPVLDSNVRIAGVQSGDYHFGRSVPGDQYDLIDNAPGIEPVVTPFKGFVLNVFNKKQGVMSNKLVRQAFVAALDLDELILVAGPGPLGQLQPSLMPKESVWFSESGSEKYNEHNLERAKELLSQSGYAGEPIRWLVTEGSRHDVALAVQQQLEPLGFKFDIQIVDWPTLTERRAKPELMDIFSSENTYRTDPTQMIIFTPTWPGWWENEDISRLMTELNRESDFDKRYAIWEEMQAIFWEDVPAARLWDYAHLNVLSNKLKGYTNMPDPIFWNVWLSD